METEKKSRGLIHSFGQFVRQVVWHVSSATDAAAGSSRKSKEQRKIQNCLDIIPDWLVRNDSMYDVTALPGVVGIHNHGNTCFINAVIQCLSNTERLTGYFITDRYRDDMQRSQKHGSGARRRFGGGKSGELTEHLACLLKSLWSCRYVPEMSGEFKKVLGRHGAQYQGYAQHDAQEFLLWLLDKVHDDLNVATKKKYQTNKGSHGRPDDVVANEALANHARCNNSFIYDRFQALYRSSLTCPNCTHQSNTFDPFLSVSLPIPHTVQHSIYVTVVYQSATPRQVRIGLLMAHGTTVYDLRQILASDTKIPEEQLVIIEIDEDGFGRTFCDMDSTSELHDSSYIYAIETPSPSVQTTTDLLRSSDSDGLGSRGCENNSAVVHSAEKEEEVDVLILAINKVDDDINSRRFTEPLSVRVSPRCTVADLQMALLREISVRLCDGVSTVLNVTSSVFRIIIVDSVNGECALPPHKYPLSTDIVRKTLERRSFGSGPTHLKLVAIWDKFTLKRWVSNSVDSVEEHESVRQVKLSNQQPPHCTLDDCFQVYTQKEQLGFEDAWLCPNCRQRQQGTMKSLSLWSLPDLLIIHLKRFKQDAQQRTKLNTLVSFPLAGLDMSRHVPCGRLASFQQQTGKSGSGGGQWLAALKPGGGGRKTPDMTDAYMYDLYAVCNHYGNMIGGHYTAFCKNPANGVWYSFNDSRVAPLSSEHEVSSRAAYLLFYEKRSSRLDSLSDPHSWLRRVPQFSATAAAFDGSATAVSSELPVLISNLSTTETRGDCESSDWATADSNSDNNRTTYVPDEHFASERLQRRYPTSDTLNMLECYCSSSLTNSLNSTDQSKVEQSEVHANRNLPAYRQQFSVMIPQSEEYVQVPDLCASAVRCTSGDAINAVRS